jgi:hypothetical protein
VAIEIPGLLQGTWSSLIPDTNAVKFAMDTFHSRHPYLDTVSFSAIFNMPIYFV